MKAAALIAAQFHRNPELLHAMRGEGIRPDPRPVRPSRRRRRS